MKYILRVHPGDQFPPAILFLIGQPHLCRIQHLAKKLLAPVRGMDLEEGLPRTVRVKHCHDLSIHIPKAHRIFQLEVVDVHVDMPDPVIPAQQRPGVIVAVIKQADLAQKFADAPVVIFVLIHSHDGFHFNSLMVYFLTFSMFFTRSQSSMLPYSLRSIANGSIARTCVTSMSTR